MVSPSQQVVISAFLRLGITWSANSVHPPPLKWTFGQQVSAPILPTLAIADSVPSFACDVGERPIDKQSLMATAAWRDFIAPSKGRFVLWRRVWDHPECGEHPAPAQNSRRRCDQTKPWQQESQHRVAAEDLDCLTMIKPLQMSPGGRLGGWQGCQQTVDAIMAELLVPYSFPAPVNCLQILLLLLLPSQSFSINRNIGIVFSSLPESRCRERINCTPSYWLLKKRHCTNFLRGCKDVT